MKMPSFQPMVSRGMAQPVMVGIILTALCLTLPTPAVARWRHYTSCQLVENAFFDGDSFHVTCGRQVYIFRLYFVDAPETDNRFSERVKEQAAYWDLTPEQAITLGKRAARFSRRFLSKPFTVHTQRIDARGQSKKPRYFAMIETEAGFLSNALVRNGLARLYGCSTDLPDGHKASWQWAQLRQAEKRARRDGLGGWGYLTTDCNMMLSGFEMLGHIQILRTAHRLDRNVWWDRPMQYRHAR